MLGERTGTLDCDLCSAAKKADKSRTERPREATVDEMLGIFGFSCGRLLQDHGQECIDL